MGKSIRDRQFVDSDYIRFEARIRDQLEQFRSVISRPDFGQGDRTLGAEVELYLVDKFQRPLARNQEILSALPNSGLALEVNRYNLELNLDPVSATGLPFTAFENQISQLLGLIDAQLEPGQQALPIGILPTLKRSDFGKQFMTQADRFVAISRVLRAQRGENFRIAIDGQQSIRLDTEDLTIEGANTSMQLHVRVTPDEFSDWFNAIQLVTPIALGLSTNSPLLFGRQLWHETRIPLFRQSVDGRSMLECERAVPSRVDFGSGWLRGGAYEFFAEQVNLHSPILPIIDSDKDAQIEPPMLSELRLHNGTIWPWNRAVYDPVNGGHLRIELRALPAGPTAIDMVANAAFILGAASYYRTRMDEWIYHMPFETLSSNFYAAAKQGLAADLYWPVNSAKAGLSAMPLLKLAEKMLSEVDLGLTDLGVASDDRQRLLEVIEQRIARNQTGSQWLVKELGTLRQRFLKPDEALTQLLVNYRTYSNQNIPVAYWPNTV